MNEMAQAGVPRRPGAALSIQRRATARQKRGSPKPAPAEEATWRVSPPPVKAWSSTGRAASEQSSPAKGKAAPFNGAPAIESNCRLDSGFWGKQVSLQRSWLRLYGMALPHRIRSTPMGGLKRPLEMKASCRKL